MDLSCMCQVCRAAPQVNPHQVAREVYKKSETAHPALQERPGAATTVWDGRGGGQASCVYSPPCQELYQVWFLPGAERSRGEAAYNGAAGEGDGAAGASCDWNQGKKISWGMEGKAQRSHWVSQQEDDQHDV